MDAMVFLHLLGAAIWVGGLLFVALVAVAARRAVGERERAELFRVIGTGFLVLGGLAAALLALSGNVLVDDMFGGWDGLGDSGAGGLVLCKTAAWPSSWCSGRSSPARRWRWGFF